MTTGDEGKAMKLSYEQRKLYACDVCGNVPDDDGILSHGRGCYVISVDGGGEEFVEMKELEGKVELPELMSTVEMPVKLDMWNIIAANGTLFLANELQWAVNVINAVYHPTHGLKQQLSDLRQRVRELERERDDAVADHVWKGE